jgi:hypothetical protein
MSDGLVVRREAENHRRAGAPTGAARRYSIAETAPTWSRGTGT